MQPNSFWPVFEGDFTSPSLRIWQNPMGEACKDALQVGFNRAIRLEFHGTRLSSNGSLIAHRDLDDAFTLTSSGAGNQFDFRAGSNIRHSMTALLRQSVYSRLAGYEDERR